MLPAHNCPGHIAAVDQFTPSNFPDMIDTREDALLVGEDHGDATGSSADLPAHLLFSRAVQRRERLIEQQEIIVPQENAGKVQALKFPP